MNSILRTL